MPTIKSGRAVCTDITVAVPLSTMSYLVRRVDIQALQTNTGFVYVGDENVLSSAGGENGVSLDAREVLTLHDIDLADVFIATTVADEGVTYLAEP